ncbi:ABC transporter permease subunit [Aeromicrobium sp. SMF47]|uniref:ABC transporter permease subunit n=1 Tax=Aeromicrobium yanjiei TaxID=2662028 RepID=A0A5Q2MLQ5_9ACTN|nr:MULTISPECIES: ABC transporter permease [Aeromicrobium]MRJ76789.1 ABC transporter permease subunit [Aeromicrobium yanjiei]MRK01133.1 ABC transporter permease subunit [Aeromicrobium sp. S22]QGG42076.1 ABC transporter permease subunit [Aeromicrobium yanjiei]
MSETHPGQERFVAPLDETPLRAIDAVDVDAVPESQWKEAWKRLRKSPLFWLASLIILVLAVMVAFPTLFTSADPNEASLGKQFAPPSEGHPFGYNFQGADIWARTVYGARASVAVGVLATVVTVVLGMVTGAIAGFYGGIVDTIVSRLSDIFFSIPLLLACIVVISVINNLWDDRGFWGSVLVVVMALALFAWPQITRQMRGAVLEVKNLEFVDAATAIGASKVSNLRRHIVPNALSPVIVSATIMLGVFIVSESSLSFLGLGFPQSMVSWGNDLADAQTLVRSGQHLVVMWVPATALAITVLGFVLLGEAVREALDPKAKKS